MKASSLFPVLILTCLAAVSFQPGEAAPLPAQDGTREVSRLLTLQQQAWNRGDLTGFMEGYWNSSQLTFFSGANWLQGWGEALQRYQSRYQGTGKEMGQLDFTDLRIQILGPEAAFVRGRWHLTFKNGDQRGGLFTLVLKKISGQWRIIHDHTSAAS